MKQQIITLIKGPSTTVWPMVAIELEFDQGAWRSALQCNAPSGGVWECFRGPYANAIAAATNAWHFGKHAMRARGVKPITIRRAEAAFDAWLVSKGQSRTRKATDVQLEFTFGP
jgi:hypothetical protein